MNRIAIMVAGTIAMVIAAITPKWWVVSHFESLGLRGGTACGLDSCESHAYGEGMFGTLGTLAFYAAFATAALAIVVLVMRLQKIQLASRAAELTTIFAVIALGLAIAFIATRPSDISFQIGSHEHFRLFTQSLSIGWAIVMYIVGALAAIGGSILASAEK